MINKEKTEIIVKISPVIMGVKPAELFNVKNDNLKYCKEIINNFSLVNLVKMLFIEKYSAHQVLFYHHNCLQDTLEKKSNNRFLVSQGYPEKVDVGEYLKLLKEKNGKSLSHEIGIFLGYPLKDVLGFMKLTSAKPLSNSKGWRYYGTRKISEEKYNRFNIIRSLFRELSNNDEFMGILSMLLQ